MIFPENPVGLAGMGVGEILEWAPAPVVESSGLDSIDGEGYVTFCIRVLLQL